jgi:hypothetical protein
LSKPSRRKKQGRKRQLYVRRKRRSKKEEDDTEKEVEMDIDQQDKTEQDKFTKAQVTAILQKLPNKKNFPDITNSNHIKGFVNALANHVLPHYTKAQIRDDEFMRSETKDGKLKTLKSVRCGLKGLYNSGLLDVM